MEPPTEKQCTKIHKSTTDKKTISNHIMFLNKKCLNQFDLKLFYLI